MTQYLLSVHISEDNATAPDDEMQQIFADVDTFNARLQAEGSWVFGGGLHPSSAATVVRVDNGQVVTTDGPYAESKEHLGGFWIVDVPDLDAALALAAAGAAACRGPVEVRPFQDEPPAE